MLNRIVAGVAFAFISTPALADDGAGLDWTPLAVAAIPGVMTVLGIVATWILNKSVKDAEMRARLASALQNSLGALQQAAQQNVALRHPQSALPQYLVKYVPAVNYVIAHVPEAVAHFGLTPAVVAEKVAALIGVANIATNLATTASSANPIVAPPLSPVPLAPTALDGAGARA